MRKVASADLDLSDRLTVEVDPDSDLVDWDGAVARFLLAYVRSRRQLDQRAGTAAAPPIDLQSAADKKESCK